MVTGKIAPVAIVSLGSRRAAKASHTAIELGDEVSFLEKELIEIDENLCRAELTPAQRAAAIKRRKEIWEALHPGEGEQVEQIVPPVDVRKHGHAQAQAFAAETAAISGQSKRDINHHLSRAEALGDDLLKVAGTSLDKGACAHVCTRPSALLVAIRNQLEHPDQKAETEIGRASCRERV